MLSLFSTLGGLLISGLPRLLDFFQNKADQKHELALANIQVQMQLQMMAQGFAAQERMEEIRTDQIAMQSEAQMTEAALKHDEKVVEQGAAVGRQTPDTIGKLVDDRYDLTQQTNKLVNELSNTSELDAYKQRELLILRA